MLETLISRQHLYVSTPEESDLIFIFADENIYLLPGFMVPPYSAITSSKDKPKGPFYCFATTNNQRCLLAQREELPSLPSCLQAYDIRQFLLAATASLKPVLVLARHLHHWRSSHLYCGSCGHHLEDVVDECARLCRKCHRTVYPRISPCMIVLVTNGNRILLARSQRSRRPYFSTLAGFIEPGESAEQAVHREVHEEVGIAITNVRYWGSQPWPFPDLLMLGFFADYAAGDIRIDPQEIIEAAWYSIHNLPPLPPAMSIARQLIEHYIQSIA